MKELIHIEVGDRELLASIDATMREAARRSGDWLVCRPGCTQCCFGPFAITRLDALRMRGGLDALSQVDPERAGRIRARAKAYVTAITPLYPGNPVTGELFNDDALPELMDDVPCPALDPESGCCDLYEARPVTCRAFGPVTRVEGGAVAACELCYVGATDEQIAACAVDIDPEALEPPLLDALGATGERGLTIVAHALLD